MATSPNYSFERHSVHNPPVSNTAHPERVPRITNDRPTTQLASARAVSVSESDSGGRSRRQHSSGASPFRHPSRFQRRSGACSVSSGVSGGNSAVNPESFDESLILAVSTPWRLERDVGPRSVSRNRCFTARISESVFHSRSFRAAACRAASAMFPPYSADRIRLSSTRAMR